MRIALTFGFVAVISASAGAAAQHLTEYLAPVPQAPEIVVTSLPTVLEAPRQSATHVRRAPTRAPVAVESNPYGPVPEMTGRLGEIAGHESGLADPEGDTTYRRVAGPRPHIASNPYFYSDVDDGLEHKADPSLGAMIISSNPYAH